jgi:hypothetical protein
MWTSIAVASRNIAQIVRPLAAYPTTVINVQQIWIHVPFERVDKDKNVITTTQSVIEKKTMINLVRGISLGLLHYPIKIFSRFKHSP